MNLTICPGLEPQVTSDKDPLNTPSSKSRVLYNIYCAEKPHQFILWVKYPFKALKLNQTVYRKYVSGTLLDPGTSN